MADAYSVVSAQYGLQLNGLCQALPGKWNTMEMHKLYPNREDNNTHVAQLLCLKQEACVHNDRAVQISRLWPCTIGSHQRLHPFPVCRGYRGIKGHHPPRLLHFTSHHKK